MDGAKTVDPGCPSSRTLGANVFEATPSPVQRAMIGNRQIQTYLADNRADQAFSLTKRLMKHQPKRQRGLDRQASVDRISFGRSFAGRRPMSPDITADPDPHIATLAKRRHVDRSIFHHITILRDLVVAGGMELERHRWQSWQARKYRYIPCHKFTPHLPKCASTRTPASEISRPPSKASITSFSSMAGKEFGDSVSSGTADIAEAALSKSLSRQGIPAIYQIPTLYPLVLHA